MEDFGFVNGKSLTAGAVKQLGRFSQTNVGDLVRRDGLFEQLARRCHEDAKEKALVLEENTIEDGQDFSYPVQSDLSGQLPI